MPEQDLQLQINSTIYQGWESVSVRRSLDYFASSFDLTLTDNQAGQARTIKLGSPCTVLVEGETVITGYVDLIRLGYDGKSRKLTVSGRSKTADIVDCSLPPRELNGSQQNNRTILDLAKAVCDPLKIGVSNMVSGLQTRRISDIVTEQTFYEFLESQARLDGVMLVSDPQGNLLICRASKDKIKTALVLGENIEAAEGEFNGRDRFSVYYIDAQQPGLDTISGEEAAHISGQAEDINVRYRPTSVNLSNANLAETKRYAEWQRNVQYGRSRQTTYTVSGWRHSDGLWVPNKNVLVKDEWMGFTGKDGQGEWLMIGTVEYIYDKKGKHARMTVMPKEAYDLVPLPVDDGGDW